MKNTKISPEQKLEAVKAYLKGDSTLRKLAAEYGVHHSSIEKWVFRYRTFGMQGLEKVSQNQKYSEDLKRKAVLMYLSEELPLRAVCEKYQISTTSLLQGWVKKYKAENTLILPQK